MNLHEICDVSANHPDSLGFLFFLLFFFTESITVSVQYDLDGRDNVKRSTN